METWRFLESWRHTKALLPPCHWDPRPKSGSSHQRLRRCGSTVAPLAISGDSKGGRHQQQQFSTSQDHHDHDLRWELCRLHASYWAPIMGTGHWFVNHPVATPARDSIADGWHHALPASPRCGSRSAGWGLGWRAPPTQWEVDSHLGTTRSDYVPHSLQTILTITE